MPAMAIKNMQTSKYEFMRRSWHEQLEAGGWVVEATGGRAEKFDQDDFEDVPGFHTRSDTSGDGFPAASAGEVDVEDGVAFGIGEQGSGADNFVDVIQHGGLRNDGQGAARLPWTGHEDATLVSTAMQGQGGMGDAMFGGKPLDAFVDDVAILQADDKDATELSLAGFHGTRWVPFFPAMASSNR